MVAASMDGKGGFPAITKRLFRDGWKAGAARKQAAKELCSSRPQGRCLRFWLPHPAGEDAGRTVPPKMLLKQHQQPLPVATLSLDRQQKCRRRAALQFNKERIFMTTRYHIPHPNHFLLGQIVATPGALEACRHDHLLRCLARHVHGDWGCVDKQDAATNNEAVKAGFRILSAYPIDESKPCKGFGDNTLWIITEADRSVTTFLLPSEY
jgi:hypothetical protein